MPGRKRDRSGSLFGERPAATMQEVDESIFGNLAAQDRQRALTRATISGSSMQIGAFRFEPTRLGIEGTVQPHEWEAIGETLLFMGRGAQWWIGDWLAFGENTWGKTYKEVAAQTGYSAKTLREYAYVSRQVDSSIRMDNLTFRHHQLVAGLEPDAQRQWLVFAAEHDLSISQMREAMVLTPPTPLPQVEGWNTLFAPEIKRHFNKLFALGIKAGQGDPHASEQLLSQIEQHRRWLDEIERLVRDQS